MHFHWTRVPFLAYKACTNEIAEKPYNREKDINVIISLMILFVI